MLEGNDYSYCTQFIWYLNCQLQTRNKANWKKWIPSRLNLQFNVKHHHFLSLMFLWKSSVFRCSVPIFALAEQPSLQSPRRHKIHVNVHRAKDRASHVVDASQNRFGLPVLRSQRQRASEHFSHLKVIKFWEKCVYIYTYNMHENIFGSKLCI